MFYARPGMMGDIFIILFLLLSEVQWTDSDHTILVVVSSKYRTHSWLKLIILFSQRPRLRFPGHVWYVWHVWQCVSHTRGIQGPSLSVQQAAKSARDSVFWNWKNQYEILDNSETDRGGRLGGKIDNFPIQTLKIHTEGHINDSIKIDEFENQWEWKYSVFPGSVE